MYGYTMPLLLIGLLLAVAIWQNGRRASERATHAARESCRREGLQLLDDTVALQRIGLRRITSGRVALQRHYRFEYSEDGERRRVGFVIVTAGQIESIGLGPRGVV